MALHVALIEPQMPPNTGTIARLCAATDTSLHLIQPLGFSLDDAQLRQAGRDCWDAVDLWVHPGWRSFRDAMARERCFYFSSRAERPLSEAVFGPTSVLLFGNETRGLPDRMLEKYPDRCFRLPMPGERGQSPNLAAVVGIVLQAALQQVGTPEAAREAARIAEGGEAAPKPAARPARRRTRRRG